MDGETELAEAQEEVRALDRSYAMLNLAKIDCAANMAIATLPKSMRRPFLACMAICQDAYKDLQKDE